MTFKDFACTVKTHWKTAALVLLLIVIILLSATVAGLRQKKANEFTNEFRAQIANCQLPGPNPPPNTGHDCYDEGVRRTSAVINDLRLSIDCSSIWTVAEIDKRPIPERCAEVVARIQELESGKS